MYVVMFEDLSASPNAMPMVDHKVTKGKSAKASIYATRSKAESYATRRNDGNTRFKFFVAELVID